MIALDERRARVAARSTGLRAERHGGGEGSALVHHLLEITRKASFLEQRVHATLFSLRELLGSINRPEASGAVTRTRLGGLNTHFVKASRSSPK